MPDRNQGLERKIVDEVSVASALRSEAVVSVRCSDGRFGVTLGKRSTDGVERNGARQIRQSL